MNLSAPQVTTCYPPAKISVVRDVSFIGKGELRGHGVQEKCAMILNARQGEGIGRERNAEECWDGCRSRIDFF